MIRIERINSPDPGAVSATPILPMATSLPALPERWGRPIGSTLR
jgi:hypothetical protein